MKLSSPFSSSVDSPSSERPTSSSKKGWKPFSLRWPFLLGMIVVCLGLMVLLQLLLHYQRMAGGIIFAPTLDNFSIGDTFVYLYLPTVISTVLGLAWAWIDLDAKRLEPYFQLSKPEGATGEKTVLLDYSTDFIAMVPLRALRKRHWPVFLAGLAMVLVFWGLTPITAAIFNLDILPTNVPVSAINSARLVGLEEQMTRWNGNIFNAAYAYSWLNTKLPTFVTPQAAFAPFDVQGKAQDPYAGNSTVTAPTTRFFTNLTCTPGQKTNSSGCSSTYVGKDFYHVENGEGCKVPVYAEVETDVASLSLLEYRAWRSSEWTDMGLDQSGCSCPASFANTFFAHLQPPLSDDPTIAFDSGNFSEKVAALSTDLFCSTTYWQQAVNVTISTQSQAVLNYTVLAQPVPLDPALLNTTHFELVFATGLYALNTGAGGSLGALGTADADIYDAYIPEERTHLQKRYPNTSFVDTPLAVYAFTDNLQPFTEYRDPTRLAAAWQSAHQLLFSFAVNKVLEPLADGESVSGTYVTTQGAVVMDERFTVLAQAFLAIIACLSSALIFTISCRESRLRSDPSSLVSVLGMTSRPLQQVINDAEWGKAQENQMAHNITFRFDSRSRIVVFKREASQSQNRWSDGEATPSRPAYPWSMRLPMQAGLLTALIGSIVALVLVYSLCNQKQGFIAPTSNAFVSQIILTYLPTAFATSLEPVWVMLARDLSFLQPFATLFQGDAPARRTIAARYTSRPPQFNAITAALKQHWLLAILSLNALLANILNVAMGGLFQPRIVRILYPTTFSQHNTAVLRNVSGLFDSEGDVALGGKSEFDYLFALKNTYESPPQLPPWSNEDTFFLPLDINNISRRGDSYQVTTTGISLDVPCTSNGITVTMPNASFLLASPSVGTSLYHPEDCEIVWELGMHETHTPNPVFDRGKKYAAETFRPLRDRTSGMRAKCRSSNFAAWLRASESKEDSVSALLSNTTTNTSVRGVSLFCTPIARTSLFDVRVNPSGHILEAQPSHRNVSVELAKVNETVVAIYGQLPGTVLVGTYTNQDWHMASFAGSWMSYFISRATGSNSLVDPASALPDPQKVASEVSNVQRRWFAMYMALNADQLEPLPNDAVQSVPGHREVAEQRMFFAPYVFEISVALLSLDIALVLLVIAFRPKRILLHKPTNIAAVVRMACHSRLLDDLITGQTTTDEVSKNRNRRYGYGTFLGVDRKLHVGIEEYPTVIARTSRLEKTVGQPRQYYE